MKKILDFVNERINMPDIADRNFLILIHTLKEIFLQKIPILHNFAPHLLIYPDEIFSDLQFKWQKF